MKLKTFIQFITEARERERKVKQYKGTPVVVDTHGAHAKKPVRHQLGLFKGTAVVVDTHGQHSEDPEEKKKLEESRRRRYLNSGVSGVPTIHKSFNKWLSTNENGHLGDDDDEVHEKMSDRYSFDEVPNDDAVKGYTRASKYLNRGLLDHYNDGKKPPRHIEGHDTQRLDAALDHHALKHDLHVYSGVGFHPGIAASQDPESKLHLPAYTSTTIAKKKAFEFGDPQHGDTHPYNHRSAKHILHIHLKKGQKGTYIGSHSQYPDEKEFLLPRHTTLKVHPVPTVLPATMYSATPQKTFVWHAHVVPNEPRDQMKLPLQDTPKTAEQKAAHKAAQLDQIHKHINHKFDYEDDEDSEDES